MSAPLKQLRSWRNGFWFALSERIGFSRGTHRERPALTLSALPPPVERRVGELRERYGVRFEASLGAKSALMSYEYLGILDQAFAKGGRPAAVRELHDVGCASFWYASVLDAFFRPAHLMGIEIEGHRLLRDVRARIDYARGYTAELPNAEFRVGDYRECDRPADLISAWFPFVTDGAILAWRLPLSLLKPAELYAKIGHNLTPGGTFFQVNHGEEEAARAHEYCNAAGLKLKHRQVIEDAISAYRLAPPVASLWQKSTA
jgi:hypothetical protein